MKPYPLKTLVLLEIYIRSDTCRNLRGRVFRRFPAVEEHLRRKKTRVDPVRAAVTLLFNMGLVFADSTIGRNTVYTTTTDGKQEVTTVLQQYADLFPLFPELTKQRQEYPMLGCGSGTCVASPYKTKEGPCSCTQEQLSDACNWYRHMLEQERTRNTLVIIALEDERERLLAKQAYLIQFAQIMADSPQTSKENKMLVDQVLAQVALIDSPEWRK